MIIVERNKETFPCLRVVEDPGLVRLEKRIKKLLKPEKND